MKGNFEKSCIIGSKEFYDKTLHVRNCNMIFCKKHYLYCQEKLRYLPQIFTTGINLYIISTNFTFLL